MIFKFDIRMFAVLIVLALLLATPVFAQDAPPVDPPSGAFDLDAIIASLIVYLLALGALATACQAAINKMKPVILHPLREMFALDERAYLIVMYIAQFVFAAVGMATLGWDASLMRALAPVLAVFPVPSPVVLLLSMLIIVAGQEFIYGLIKGLYATQDAVKALDGTLTPAKQ